ncbi:unnamed protein product [Lactuca saligna]|uniref:Uncharacterized protein n=1 Tax=Lactuca saligna TaxID=75948 RepID=A0AA35Y7M8_LACSI|nr:unnamed protein product [Lactuca saligna]
MLRKLYDEEQIEEDKFEEEEEEDSGPIYDTDGEGEFCERINFLVEEEFIEEIEEETNFVIGDEFVEAIVEEINFVDMDKIVEEIVIFVEQQISFQELTTTRANDYKCHKNSGSHMFYEHNFFSKDLKEIQIGSFIDQEGLFVFHLHFRFKVWEIFTLWRPWNAYILHFEGLGERFDFTNYDLNNDVFVLSSFIDQKEKKDLCITFDKKFCAIRDGDFSFMAQKQQDQLFLDDGRILYPSKDIMMISKKICVHGGINQSPKEALRGNSYAHFLCCPQTKHIFINSSFIVQKHQDQWREVCWERKKKDGIHLFTNHLSKRKSEDASPMTEEFIEEIEEETNFVIGDEFVEAIVEEINFVDMDKIVEEIVIFVEQQISFQELTTTRTNDYKCHKNSGSHIFYEHNFFSKDLKEIQIGSFIDQEGLFVFHLHFRFKVWEIFTLWRPWNAYILHFEGLGERFDFTNYDLNNDVFVLSSFIDQRRKKDLCITFDKKFCAIRDGDFSFMASKTARQLFWMMAEFCTLQKTL